MLLRLPLVVVTSWLVVASLLATTLGGCWSGGPSPITPAQPAAPAAGAATQGRAGTASLVGGTLRFLGASPDTLDPAVAQDATSWGYLLQVFSGLVGLNDKLEVIPELAASWTTDSSGKVYTFNLRNDAQFHDGTPLTAVDLKYSFERATDPKLRSSVADIYLGDIVGVEAKLAGRAPDISGVKVRGDYVLEVAIDDMKPYFISKLTYPTAYAVSRKNVEQGGDWWKRPSGSGPFKLKSWQPDREILLEANSEYYGTKPKLAAVSYFLGGGSPVPMFERGEVDVVEVGAADVERVTDDANPLNQYLVVTPQLSIWYFGFNTRAKPFDDVKVRQAFNYATDKQRLVDISMRKIGVVAQGILPPGLPGFDPAFKGFPFDLERAKQLLAESSYGGADKLPPITLSVGQGGASRAQRFAQMYQRNLGIDIAVEQVDRGFFDDLNAERYQMFSLGWVADYPDPQDFLDVLFHSRSSGNHSGYSSDTVDALLEQARAEQDTQKRWAIYSQAEARIVEDAPWVPLYHDVDYALVKPHVKGLVWTPMGIISLKNVSLEAKGASVDPRSVSVESVAPAGVQHANSNICLLPAAEAMIDRFSGGEFGSAA